MSWTSAPSGHARNFIFLCSERWGESFWPWASARIFAWTSVGYPAKKLSLWAAFHSEQWPHLIIPEGGPIHISPANRFMRRKEPVLKKTGPVPSPSSTESCRTPKAWPSMKALFYRKTYWEHSEKKVSREPLRARNSN